MPLTRKKSNWEIYSQLRVRPPFIIRADGRGFSKLLSSFEKPYDESFARSMASSVMKLFTESGLSPRFAFMFSDEVSLLFTDEPFGGRLEKLDSVIPAFLSGALSLSLGFAVSMDSRAVIICRDEISRYLQEGQDEAWRNHVFSLAFYTLVQEGASHEGAMSKLRGLPERSLHEMLYSRGINAAKSPSWQRRGIMIYRMQDRLIEAWEIPLFNEDEGKQLLQALLQ
jgi:tRNA(His) 5'-end guanylyltransferase